MTTSASRAVSPAPIPTTPTTAVPMTKEEKAAEMARRKEERKQVSFFVTFSPGIFSDVFLFISEDCDAQRAKETRRG